MGSVKNFFGSIYLALRKCLRSYSGPHFSAFELNTQSECGKTWIRIIPQTDTFYAVYMLNNKRI